MPEESFIVVYDVLREGSGTAIALPWLVIGVFILAVWLRARRTSRRFTTRFLGIWLLAWVSGSALGFGNVLYQRSKCLAWATSGDFEVVEGDVTQFVPMPYSGHAMESFVVGGQGFRYSDYDISKGGFNNTASHGGPIRDGLHVRISHREGRILKIEVRD